MYIINRTLSLVHASYNDPNITVSCVRVYVRLHKYYYSKHKTVSVEPSGLSKAQLNQYINKLEARKNDLLHQLNNTNSSIFVAQSVGATPDSINVFERKRHQIKKDLKTTEQELKTRKEEL